jgi:murein L,D-transpeptidase YcbB/YkuD
MPIQSAPDSFRALRSFRAAALLLCSLTCFTAFTACGGESGETREGVVQALDALTRSGRGLPGIRPSAAELTELRRLYQSGSFTPLWFSASGDLRKIGKEALARLADAQSEGLRPEDYRARQLDSLAKRASDEKSADPQTVAQLDAGLSLAMLEFIRHVHAGRVNPRSIGLSMDTPKDRHDYVTMLEAALREGELEELVAELAPPLEQYRLARRALADYRARALDSVADQPLKLPVPLKPGASDPAIAGLTRRLALLGDLPDPPQGEAATRYEGPLVDAVRRFQGRHGLVQDSVLGKQTLEELNVPLAWRAHQLELALERLRWLRDLGNEPLLMVNIPMFELTAWTSPMVSGPPAFRTGVIVGKALDTETPVFAEEMRYVIFQPYWNIPPSIVREETIPAIEKDENFLQRNGMEIVQGQGDDADPVELSGGALQKVIRGELRIRQRPGPANALGPIKFVFPNNQNIYLHSTPAEQLFDRARRDFSHGCVRVEDVAGLAEWVLADNPEWSRPAIEQALADGSKLSRRVNLSRPLKVVLFYSTATVEPDGTVRFGRDIYQHDPELDRALHLAID